MNRVSMRSSSSPFKRMSFESTTDFLRAATLTGDHDELTVSKFAWRWRAGLHFTCLDPYAYLSHPPFSRSISCNDSPRPRVWLLAVSRPGGRGSAT